MTIPFGTLAFFVWRIAAMMFADPPAGRVFAGLALLFGISGTATFAQIGLSTSEVLVAAFIIAALFCLLRAIEENQPGCRGGLLLPASWPASQRAES